MSKLKSIFCVALALVFLMSANAFAAKIDDEEELCACSHPNPRRVYYGTQPQFVLGDAYYYYNNQSHYCKQAPLYFCDLCQSTFADWDNPDTTNVFGSHVKGVDCSWCDGTFTHRAYRCTLCKHKYTASKFACPGSRCPYPHNQITSLIDPSN